MDYSWKILEWLKTVDADTARAFLLSIRILRRAGYSHEEATIKTYRMMTGEEL